MKRFRYEYGHGPVHLLAAIACFAISAWALAQALDVLASPGNFVIWLLGSIIAHDFLLLPVYSLLGLVAARSLRTEHSPTRLRIAALNHLRVPALLSGLALLVWFPVVAGAGSDTFTRASGLSNDIYFERWLALSAALFLGSALLLALRARTLRETE
jgi:hypothetical protein